MNAASRLALTSFQRIFNFRDVEKDLAAALQVNIAILGQA